MKKLSTSDKWAAVTVIMLFFFTALDNAYIMAAAYSIALVVGLIIAYKKGQMRNAIIAIVVAGIVAAVLAFYTLSRR